MKLIDRLYTLHNKAGTGALIEIWEALPKLLAVVEAAQFYIQERISLDDSELYCKLLDALAALEEEV